METIITIDRTKELKNCLFNSINANNLMITFFEDNIFIDNTIVSQAFIILDTISGISKITKGDPIAFKINPIHFMSALNMCFEDTEFQIVISDTTWKIIQRNKEYTSLIIENMEFIQSSYQHRGISSNYANEIQCEYGSLKINMNDLINAFKQISQAEEYQKFSPFYKISISETKISLKKGIEDSNCIIISFDDFKYTGKSISIQLSDHLDYILKLFIKDQDITVNCIDKRMIHFSQITGRNTRREFMLGGMTHDYM